MFKQLVPFKLEDTARDKNPRSNVYNYVDQQPAAGYNVRDYIQRNLKYPEASKQANIEQSVPVKFVVNEDGHISDALLLRTIAGGYDEEALRVISGMPPWLAGEQNGKKVKVYAAELVTFANTAR